MASSVAGSLSSRALWSQLKSVPVKYPFYFGVGLSTVKTSFSDLLVQKAIEKREKIDWKRNMAFASFGFFYLGGVQYGIYVNLFQRLFPGAAAFAAKPLRAKLQDTKGMLQVIAQVVLDQAVHHPLMYFPTFYVIKEFVMKEKPDIGECLSTYRQNMKEDLLALWKVWVPSTLVNFAFMPMYARIPFVAGTSLLWTCILSVMRGGDVEHAEEIAGGSVTGATMTLFKEVLEEMYTCPVELDKDMSHVMLTASGIDRKGLVAQFARAVQQEGGNVTHSKMVRLGNEFIISVHVAVEPGKYSKFVKAVKKNPQLQSLAIDARVLNRRKTGAYDEAVMWFQFHAVGTDRPGMLATISEKLTDLGLNIETVNTELRANKLGGREFVIDTICTTSNMGHRENIQDLVHEMHSLKDPLDLRTLDVRVHVEKT